MFSKLVIGLHFGLGGASVIRLKTRSFELFQCGAWLARMAAEDSDEQVSRAICQNAPGAPAA
jgi:hypothetical protein